MVIWPLTPSFNTPTIEICYVSRPGGVVGLTYRPVKPKIAGSNPVGVATNTFEGYIFILDVKTFLKCIIPKWILIKNKMYLVQQDSPLGIL